MALKLTYYKDGEAGNAFVLNRPLKEIARLVPDGVTDENRILTRKDDIIDKAGTSDQLLVVGDFEKLPRDRNQYIGSIDFHSRRPNELPFGFVPLNGAEILKSSPQGQLLLAINEEEPEYFTTHGFKENETTITLPYFTTGMPMITIYPGTLHKKDKQKLGNSFEFKQLGMTAAVYLPDLTKF